MLTLALLYARQTVGEAANNVSQDTRHELPQIPWPVIIGMRHRLVHAYADIDHDILWATAVGAAPNLLKEVNNALASE